MSRALDVDVKVNLQVWVGEQFPLAAVSDTHRLLDAGTTTGKIALRA